VSPSPSGFILLDTYAISEYLPGKGKLSWDKWWLNVRNSARKSASADERKSLVLLFEHVTSVRASSHLDLVA